MRTWRPQQATQTCFRMLRQRNVHCSGDSGAPLAGGGERGGRRGRGGGAPTFLARRPGGRSAIGRALGRRRPVICALSSQPTLQPSSALLCSLSRVPDMLCLSGHLDVHLVSRPVNISTRWTRINNRRVALCVTVTSPLGSSAWRPLLEASEQRAPTARPG